MVIFIGAGPSNGIHPHAEDPDFGGISAITYTKVADPENYFSIDKKTGQITFSPRNSDDVLDRECEHCNWKEGYYNLTLEACDEERKRSFIWIYNLIKYLCTLALKQIMNFLQSLFSIPPENRYC